MSEEQLPPDLRASEDFDVAFTVRLPRAIARQVYAAADVRNVDAGPLLAALIARAFGVDLTVPKKVVAKQARFADPNVRAEVVRLHRAGMSVADIAANLDASRNAVGRWINALGLEKGLPGPRRKQEKQEPRSDRFARLAAQRDELEASA